MTPAHTEGAAAWGEIWREPDGHIRLTGTVKDTKPDGKAALAEIDISYPSGVVQQVRDYDITGYKNNAGRFLGNDSSGYTFGADANSVSVLVCLVGKTPEGHPFEHACSKQSLVIWSK